MLDRTRDTDREIDLGRHDLAGLADLVVVGNIARVDRSAARAERSAELVGERDNDVLIFLARSERTAARDDDLGRGELRPLGLCNLGADEARDTGVPASRDGFNRARATGRRRLVEGRTADREDELGV